MGTFHEDPCKFMKISCLILLGIKNVADEICRENRNTHFMLNTLFFTERMPFMVDPDRPHMSHHTYSV